MQTRLWPHGLANLTELGRLARKARADVTVAHNFTPLYGRSATFIHDAMFVDHPEWFSRSERAYFGTMLPAARRAALVVTSTQAEAARIERLAPQLRPVTAIGLAAPTAVTTAEPRRPAIAAEIDAFGLTVGRLNIRKNLGRVIAGAGRSRSITPSSPLLVVGSSDHSGVGPAGPADAEVDSLRQAGSVRFAGRLDDHELAWLYANAKVTISLSLDEGFGLTPVEAATFGQPVLVSDIPAHRETVGGYATFIDLNASVDDVANALDDAWCSASSRQALQDLRARYTWPAVVNRLREAIISPK